MTDGDALAGEVLRVDRFGNLVTNIDRKLFDKFSQSARHRDHGRRARDRRASWRRTRRRRRARCARCSAAPIISRSPSTPASASERLGLTRGAAVTIREDTRRFKTRDHGGSAKKLLSFMRSVFSW